MQFMNLISKFIDIKYLREFFFLVVILFSIQIANAQTPRYSTTSKSAINAFENGTKYYDQRDFEKAIRSFLQAIDKDPNFIEAHVILAEVLAEQGDYEAAILRYNKAIDINPTFFPNNFYQLARLEMKTSKYDRALQDFKNYKKLVKDIYPEKTILVDQGIKNCEFAIEALKHPVPFNPINMGPAINSANAEYFPSFTVDQNEIIFTRDIPDRQAMEGHQEDFYLSSKKDTSWQQALNAGSPLNSILNEGAPSISADGRLLFFAACDRSDGKGRCDIYLSQRVADGSWSKPMNIGPPINTGDWETQPSFSSDGKTLYFIRGSYSRDHGSQQDDIYYSEFQADHHWSEPKRLNDNINTIGKEESVFIHPDNQTLYFTSNGLPGMGGLDIFLSRRQPDGTWGPAMNLGYPINTSGDENSLVVSADGKKAYFASNRAGGFGSLDLYSFDLYPAAQPLLVSYLKAKVVDAETNLPLSAQFEVIDVTSGKVVLSNSTDQKRGEFLASLPAGKNYMLNVNKEQYLFYSDYFECKEATDKQHAYDLLIKLHKPKAGEHVVLKNIFFDVNKYDLKTESNSELAKLKSFLNANPTIRIEVSGHTDSTGDPKLNQTLSESRANAVYNFLVKEGISSARLTYKGYGKSKPIASNDSEEGRSQNRRTEFTIL